MPIIGSSVLRRCLGLRVTRNEINHAYEVCYKSGSISVKSVENSSESFISTRVNKIANQCSHLYSESSEKGRVLSAIRKYKYLEANKQFQNKTQIPSYSNFKVRISSSNYVSDKIYRQTPELIRRPLPLYRSNRSAFFSPSQYLMTFDDADMFVSSPRRAAPSQGIYSPRNNTYPSYFMPSVYGPLLSQENTTEPVENEPLFISQREGFSYFSLPSPYESIGGSKQKTPLPSVLYSGSPFRKPLFCAPSMRMMGGQQYLNGPQPFDPDPFTAPRRRPSLRFDDSSLASEKGATGVQPSLVHHLDEPRNRYINFGDPSTSTWEKTENRWKERTQSETCLKMPGEVLTPRVQKKMFEYFDEKYSECSSNLPYLLRTLGTKWESGQLQPNKLWGKEWDNKDNIQWNIWKFHFVQWHMKRNKTE